MQNCLSRKVPISWECSKTFSPAKLSYPQIINIPGSFKDFLACKIVLAANHQHPENIQKLFRLQAVFQPQLASSSNQKQLLATSSIPAATSNHPATSSNPQQSAVINNSQHQHDQCQILTYKTIWVIPLSHTRSHFSSMVQHIELSLFII